jgi:hypothetical protein
MALVDGGKSYRAAMAGDANNPLTLAYAKAAADTVLIKAGHPVVIPTIAITGDISNTSTTVSNVSSFTGLFVGQSISGTNIPTGARITALTPGSNQLTLSSAATATTATLAITITGGNVVRRGAVSSSALSDTKILGFSVTDDIATTNADYGGFGITIPPRLNAPGTSLEQIQVNIADGVTEFQYGILNTQTVTLGLIGQTVGLRLEDATNFQWAVDTSAGASNKIFTITRVVPEDIGKTGGRVYIQVLVANRQFPAF